MYTFTLTKAGGSSGWFQALLKGDPVALLSLCIAIVTTALIYWLSFYLMKQKGQRLADAIGDCNYTFAPDGLFGKRFFVISGNWENMPFSLDSRKTERKGDHRTILRFRKPPGITWAEIQSGLNDSSALAQAAHDIAESSDEVVMTYVGVGGDPQLIRVFLREVTSVAHRSAPQPSG